MKVDGYVLECIEKISGDPQISESFKRGMKFVYELYQSLNDLEIRLSGGKDVGISSDSVGERPSIDG